MISFLSGWKFSVPNSYCCKSFTWGTIKKETKCSIGFVLIKGGNENRDIYLLLIEIEYSLVTENVLMDDW